MIPEIQDGAPTISMGDTDALLAFMQIPTPLALVDLGGAMVLSNTAFRTRFGASTVVPESIADARRGEVGDCLLALQPADRGTVVEVAARSIRMADRMLLIIEPAGGAMERREMELLRDRVSELERLVTTDHLTGAWNRTHFDRLIKAEIARSVACRLPVSLVLLDIDDFKRINDAFGHGIGDSVLRELVRLMQSRIRPSDFLFRWGGEEFAVLVASAGYRGAERMAENFCSAVSEHAFDIVGSITVSLGVAEHFGNEDPEELFLRLDKALYAAKDAGKNRVVVDRRGNSDAWAGEPGASALHLVWQEAYECGDATIDGEHRELFVLANRLMDASSHVDAEPDAFRASLDSLLAHVQHHFADEEEILSRHHYTELDLHKRAHEGLLRRAGFLKERAEAGEATLGSVVEFLAQDVVARHLMTFDRAFFPLFAKGTTPGMPARQG